ncbi:DUF4097 domain-containing protein [Kitasatospora sp. NBC_01287]|uniref:DUF4097 family beta strand repeat-containing protein n=1 Tax=Kitasatospora sp. NBC_01287 TaxID=2903573 RepID=UPI0022561BC2|nr:DUF4097 family beta strand repeat-containing protein [Kitasatospora sp. NBC_01287]MCX4749108.1 DUF4097 domain-containing protein [Kitasatospora sp. NBC_01287]
MIRRESAGPGPRERQVWRQVGTLAGAVVVLLGAGQTWTSLVRQAAVRPDPYPSSITALELDLQDSTANIDATTQGHVAVRETEHWTVSRPQVTRTITDHTLRISARCPQLLGVSEPACSVDLDIAAPPGTAVAIRSNSGATRIRGLSGALSLRTNSGSIELDGISGRVDAQLTSGSINGQRLASAEVQAAVTSGSMDLGFAAAPRTLALACTSGSINVGLPPGSTYRLNTSGSADTDPALIDPASSNSITAVSGSGHTSLGYATG